jgi:hypothetical protein
MEKWARNSLKPMKKCDCQRTDFHYSHACSKTLQKKAYTKCDENLTDWSLLLALKQKDGPKYVVFTKALLVSPCKYRTKRNKT